MPIVLRIALSLLITSLLTLITVVGGHLMFFTHAPLIAQFILGTAGAGSWLFSAWMVTDIWKDKEF